MTARLPGTNRGRPPRTAEQRADRRAELVAGAMDAIRQLGPDASLLDIAAGAGVSKPALYAEFGDKEGLVDAIAQVSGDAIDSAIQARLGEMELDERAMVHVMVMAAIDFADHDPHVFSLVLRGLRNPDRPYETNPIRIRIHNRAKTLVEIISPHSDEEERAVITSALVGGLLSGVETWSETRRVDKEIVVQRLSAAIFAGLAELGKMGSEATLQSN